MEKKPARSPGPSGLSAQGAEAADARGAAHQGREPGVSVERGGENLKNGGKYRKYIGKCRKDIGNIGNI